MVFRCAALSVQRREHASLFLPWPESLGDFMGRDPIQLASFASACYKKDKELKTCNCLCVLQVEQGADGL